MTIQSWTKTINTPYISGKNPFTTSSPIKSNNLNIHAHNLNTRQYATRTFSKSDSSAIDEIIEDPPKEQIIKRGQIASQVGWYQKKNKLL